MIHRRRRQTQLSNVQMMLKRSMQSPHMRFGPSARTVPADRLPNQRRESNVEVLHIHDKTPIYYRDPVWLWTGLRSRGSSEDCFLGPVVSFWLSFQTIDFLT